MRQKCICIRKYVYIFLLLLKHSHFELSVNRCENIVFVFNLIEKRVGSAIEIAIVFFPIFHIATQNDTRNLSMKQQSSLKRKQQCNKHVNYEYYLSILPTTEKGS